MNLPRPPALFLAVGAILLLLVLSCTTCQPEASAPDMAALQLARQAMDLVAHVHALERQDQSLFHLFAGLGYILALGLPLLATAILLWVLARK